MARERRVFSEEFKREAVKLVNQPGATKAAIARDLGVGANLLGRWCREVSGEMTVSSGNSEKVSSQEYERMRRELAKVKVERDILKKALGYFAADLK
jgi:transposase